MKKAVSGAMLTLLFLGMLSLVFNVQPTKAASTTWTVDDDGPADFHTIQAAVSWATPGDIVFVKTGTYKEPQITISKTLQLIGEDKSTTIVDGNGSWVCFYVQSARNVIIAGFTVQNGDLYSWGSENVIITGNIISNNIWGVIIGESTNITISKNIVTQNGGILLDDSNHSRILENNITLNNGDAIWLDNSHGNIIKGNNVSYNGLGTPPGYHHRGIRLDFASSNNIIYHNNIIDNYEQASVWKAGNNKWDGGYPSGGNYWSDYNGTDYFSGPYQNVVGSDGIGDTAYVIDANNTDNYPLMNPWFAPPSLATADIAPDTLNLKSRGKWITCYIELPEGYDVGDINRTTMSLNDTIPVDPFWVDKPLESVVGDFDNDTIPDLMVKFSRAEVIDYLINQNIKQGSITLTLTGELFDGTPFEASDMIKVKMSNSSKTTKLDEAYSGNENVIVLPEFPSLVFLPLFIIATLATAVYVKKGKKQ